jgi:hypothetical protein
MGVNEDSLGGMELFESSVLLACLLLYNHCIVFFNGFPLDSIEKFGNGETTNGVFPVLSTT